MGEPHRRLSSRQLELVDSWLPGAVVDADHIWSLVERTVLEVSLGGSRFIVKAGGRGDHHIAREIRAHREWLTPWTRLGRAPLMVRSDEGAKLLVTEYLPGVLVAGSEDEQQTETYRQAGSLLAQLHAQHSVVDAEYEVRENAKTLRLLADDSQIPVAAKARLEAFLSSAPTPPSVVVPTHGDWQPRNWLVHAGEVRAIDFGRADLRPAMTDVARLATQQFRTVADAEAAFFSGYGDDPREPGAWLRMRVREAVGTAVWARADGDERFEQQGLRMVDDVLADLD